MLICDELDCITKNSQNNLASHKTGRKMFTTLSDKEHLSEDYIKNIQEVNKSKQK